MTVSFESNTINKYALGSDLQMYTQQYLYNFQTMAQKADSLFTSQFNPPSPLTYPTHNNTHTQPITHISQNKLLTQDMGKVHKRGLLNSSNIMTGLVIGVMAFVLFYLYHFTFYISISNRIRSSNNVPDEALLTHLRWLAGEYMPFGNLFIEEYIYELSKNSQWDLVLEKSMVALENSGNWGKFSIYYHQALAYCFKRMFKQCKQSITESYKYSTRDKLAYIQNVYNILISNDYATRQEMPTGVEFEHESKARGARSAKGIDSDYSSESQEYKLNQI